VCTCRPNRSLELVGNLRTHMSVQAASDRCNGMAWHGLNLRQMKRSAEKATVSAMIFRPASVMRLPDKSTDAKLGTPSAAFLGTDATDPDTASKLNKAVQFTFGPFKLPQFQYYDEGYGTQTKFASTMTAEGIYAFYPTDVYKLKGIAVSCKWADQDPEAEAAVVIGKSSPTCSFALSLRSTIKTNFMLEVSDITGSTTKNPADGLTYELSIDISRPFMFRLYPGFVIFAFWLIICIQLSLIFALSFFDFRKVPSPPPPATATPTNLVTRHPGRIWLRRGGSANRRTRIREQGDGYDR